MSDPEWIPLHVKYNLPYGSTYFIQWTSDGEPVITNYPPSGGAYTWLDDYSMCYHDGGSVNLDIFYGEPYIEYSMNSAHVNWHSEGF
jgi:hypothetical protein